MLKKDTSRHTCGASPHVFGSKVPATIKGKDQFRSKFVTLLLKKGKFFVANDDSHSICTIGIRVCSALDPVRIQYQVLHQYVKDSNSLSTPSNAYAYFLDRTPFSVHPMIIP